MNSGKNIPFVIKVFVMMLSFLFLNGGVQASSSCNVEVDLNVGFEVEFSTKDKANPWASGHIVSVKTATYKRETLGDSCFSKGIDVVLNVDMNKSEGRSISIACMAYPSKNSIPSDVSSIQLEGTGLIKVNMHLYVDELPEILDCVSEARPK
ncbi:hypothetical protein [Pseudoalteromonas sp.]|uniref:hypothetical protein n=1 Tax=Pseudoalteromonas sp. TaxID=53249 RepID=UPI0026235402|nr:hypothetical protein [Pseudoalteromonas sp.]MCP4585502.1 hypothetical protein [Pseudoalteromonas sp.]